jgi:serine/threonine protein kinase
VRSFAGYELIESLGRGASGTSFLARRTADGAAAALVVLKVIKVRVDAAGCARIAGELRAAAGVSCAALAHPAEAGHVDGTVFTVTPRAPGGSLERRSGRGDGSARATVLRACADAARAAHALHEAGIVHRAIKPANVLLDDGGGRLTDLGLAHDLSPGQTMSAIGSAAAVEYIEPAALLGQPAGRASDIWSIAVTLHRALTSTSVYGDFPADSVIGALRHVVETVPVLSAELRAGEAELISWCLDPSRRARPGTAALVAERLDRLAEAA